MVVTNKLAFKQSLFNLSKEYEQELYKTALKAAVKMNEKAARSIANPSNGRTYGNHVASVPGEAPNTDTGELLSKLFVEPLPSKRGAVFGNRAKYAKFLEFGTSRVAARPFIRPAYEAEKQKYLNEVKSIINKINRNS